MLRACVTVAVATVLVSDLMPRRRRPAYGPPDQLSEEAIAYNKYWNSLLPTKEQQEQLRDQLYGCHIEDRPREDASFIVRCICVGIMGDGLTISEARQLQAEHVHAR